MLRKDARDEIKRRIEQRDKYSIQLTISLGALVAISFSSSSFRMVLIATPLVSIYFTVLILYSYRVHDVLVKYLKEEIEPELARLYKIQPTKEWEIYYATQEVPGIRHWFFLAALWIIYILSFLYLWLMEIKQIGFTILFITTLAYGIAIAGVTKVFNKDKEN